MGLPFVSLCALTFWFQLHCSAAAADDTSLYSQLTITSWYWSHACICRVVRALTRVPPDQRVCNKRSMALGLLFLELITYLLQGRSQRLR